MEKKTIGKFIAVLRKANGLTQAELAEKLFVSDKTVSRWERDESAPDLELIPVIADLFGVTSDELLRGERVPAPSLLDKKQDETEQEKDKEKADKNLKRLFNKRLLRLKNLSLIPIGVALIGMLAAIICAIAIKDEEVNQVLLAGCIALSTSLISLICQFCFTNFSVYRDEEEDGLNEIAGIYNGRVMRFSRNVFLFLLVFLGVSLPIFALDASYDGDNYGHVLFFAFIACGCIFPSLGFFAYNKIEKSMKNNGTFIVEKKKQGVVASEKKEQKSIFFTCVFPCMVIAITLLFSWVYVVDFVDPYEFTKAFAKKQAFTEFDDFKAYMERVEEEIDVAPNTENPFTEENFEKPNGVISYSYASNDQGFITGYPYKWHYIKMYDEENNEYRASFFWSNASVYGFKAIPRGNNKIEIVLYEEGEWFVGHGVKELIEWIILAFVVADIAVFTTIGSKEYKKRKNNK